MRALWIMAACIMLSACAGTKDSHQVYLGKKGLNAPAPEKFQHCHAYGCKRIANIELSAKDWRSIEDIFEPRAQNAAQERMHIAKAIGQFETLVGAQAGTGEDRYGTFKKLGDYQQDCVDESTNSTVYLSLLQQRELLHFHDVQAPESRVRFARWPHQTAVIKETGSSARYAVDSWFHDNGFPAEVIEMPKWKKGWKPAEHFTKTSDLEQKS